LDAYLAKQHPERSRAVWQKLIKQGRVGVDGEVMVKPKLNIGKTMVGLH